MTVIKGIYFPCDEDKPAELVTVDQSDYRNIQKYTSGPFGAFDAFRPSCSIFYSDEGKIYNLPLNRKASLFLWVHRTEFRNYDALLGDVLILGPADEETGESQSVPDELVELIFNTTEYKYMVKVTGESGWHGNGRRYDNWIDAYNDALALATRWLKVEHCKVVAA